MLTQDLDGTAPHRVFHGKRLGVHGGYGQRALAAVARLASHAVKQQRTAGDGFGMAVRDGHLARLLLVMPRPIQKRVRAFLRSDPPKALGTRFEVD